jgi:hypothetical protein
MGKRHNARHHAACMPMLGLIAAIFHRTSSEAKIYLDLRVHVTLRWNLLIELDCNIKPLLTQQTVAEIESDRVAVFVLAILQGTPITLLRSLRFIEFIVTISQCHPGLRVLRPIAQCFFKGEFCLVVVPVAEKRVTDFVCLVVQFRSIGMKCLRCVLIHTL